MNETIKRAQYITPEIVKINLDHEISLALESSPPTGPGESHLITPEYLKQDPFKNQLG